ncbi:MAG: STAS domain-containing protein, partial [Acidimicrobiales bacterium]|nr:STAS domain-containing protein [Acidimicrobiales bacterium]
HLYRVQPEHVLVMLLTLGLTVFVDLLVAIAAGVVAAALAASRRFERLELDSVLSVPMLDAVFFADSDRVDISQFDAFTARVGMVKMRGSFTIASSNRLRIAISKDIVEHEVVILDFTETSYVDDSAALVVEQLIDAAMEHDTECIVIGLENLPSGSLQSLDVLHRVPGDHFVGSFDEARTIAARLLEINMESRTEA